MSDKAGTRTGLAPESEAARTMTWADLLQLARTPGHVVTIAKDFIATWDPWEIAALPEPCRPPGYFTAPEEIVDYAFTLARSEREPGPDDRGVQRMTHFFALAAQRIAALMSAAPPPEAGNDPSA
jgi:hypothetical protein